MEGSALMKFIPFHYLFSFVSGKDIPFDVGEILNYDASFSNIKAARGSLKVLDKETVNGVKTYHVQFTAYTTGITDYLFPIDDVIDLWLTEDSLIPVKVKMDINEGKYHKKSHLDLYHDSGYAIVENDTILIANGGEGDFSINFNEPNLRILPEDHYMGSNGPGVAVQFNINEMDATLISITPTYINNNREWRIILAEGRVLDSKHHNMEGPNTCLLYTSPRPRDATLSRMPSSA
mgnify:CR=1 FL=1